MAKHNLKLVEPTLQEQLEGAIAAAASAHETLLNAQAAFGRKYPGDHRLISSDLSGTVLVDADRLHDDPNAERELTLISYQREREKVADLQREAREADSAVELLRARIEAAVTEGERRVALAAAIDEADNADAALQKLRATVARADSAVADAEERHSDAAKAVKAASEAHARLFEAAIEQGHPPGRDSAVRDARRLADDAADDLTTAKAAATAMKAKLGHAEQRLSGARAAVVACAQNVVVAGLPKLLAEAQTLQAELEARREVLSMLSNFEGRRSEIDEFLEAPVFPYSYSGGRAEDHPAVAPWLQIIDELAGDADAPLPTV